MGSSFSKQKGGSHAKKDKKNARSREAPRTRNISSPAPGTFPEMQPLPAIYHRRSSDRRAPLPPRASSTRMSRASSLRASTAETINIFMEPPIMADQVTQDTRASHAQSTMYQVPASTDEPAPTRRSRPGTSSGESRRRQSSSRSTSRQSAAYQLPASTYEPAPAARKSRQSTSSRQSAYQLPTTASQLPATSCQPAPTSISRAKSSSGHSRRQSVDDRRAHSTQRVSQSSSSGRPRGYYPPSSSKGDPRTVRTRNTTENASQWRQ